MGKSDSQAQINVTQRSRSIKNKTTDVLTTTEKNAAYCDPNCVAITQVTDIPEELHRYRSYM